MVGQLDIEKAGLTFCFFAGYSVSELIDLDIKSWFSEGTVVACTGSAIITPRSYPKKGVVATSLSDSVITAVAEPISPVVDSRLPDIRKQVARLNRNLEKKIGVVPFKDVFAILLIDSTQGCEEKVASVVGSQLGGIPLCGGSAADNMPFEKVAIYCNNQWIDGGSVLVLAHTLLSFEVFSTHHYVSTSKRIVINRADHSNRRVLEMNGRPASEEYARLIGCTVDELSTDVISQYSMVVNIGGRQYVRSVIRVNEDASLTFSCAIDEGVVMRLAHGAGMVKNIEQTLERIRSHIGQLELIIGFNCAYRELEMRRHHLTKSLQSIFNKNKVIGFSAFGEQINSLHVNQTFTGIALSNEGDGYEESNIKY